MSIFGTFPESFGKFDNSTTLQENTHTMNSGHYPDSCLTLQLYEEKNRQCQFLVWFFWDETIQSKFSSLTWDFPFLNNTFKHFPTEIFQNKLTLSLTLQLYAKKKQTNKFSDCFEYVRLTPYHPPPQSRDQGGSSALVL